MQMIENGWRVGSLLGSLVLAVLVVSPSRTHAETLAEGDFDSAFRSFLSGEAVAGGYRLEDENGKRTLHLTKDFRAQKAPDLKLFLSPKLPAEVTGENATQGAVLLAVLETFEGAQTYSIPPELDLSKYRTLAVHCEAYSKLWGTGALR